MRIFLALLSIFSFSLALSGGAFAYTDSMDPYLEAIEYLTEENIVQGYADGSFRAQNPINRAEFTKIVIEATQNEYAKGASCFLDVGTEWFAPYICKAKEQHTVSGYPDGYFRPSNNINLAEALKIVLEAYDIDIPNVEGAWYEKYLLYADNEGLLFNIDRNLSKNLSRGEMAQLIFNVKNKSEPKEAVLSDLLSHQDSGIFDSKPYSQPKRVWMGSGDTLVLDNGLTLEVVHSISNSTRIALYTEADPRVYDPQPFETLRRNDKYLPPFYATHETYLYLGDFDESTSRSEIEIYSKSEDIYQRCLADESIKDMFCLLNIGRFEPVHDSYEQLSQGRFHVVYPKQIEQTAEQVMEYLPGCYNGIKDLFGKDQDIEDFSIFFYYPEEDDVNHPVYAQADGIVIPFQSFMEERLSEENKDELCGTQIFPMAHEITHVFDFGTQNTPILREGFANYVSRRFDSFEAELICEEDGYQTYFYLDDSYSSFTPYPDDSRDDSYRVGECYFQRLEKNYGILQVNELIEYLAATRNVESKGDIGYAGNINFFDDVIEPIFGASAIHMATEMGIDITCDYSVPFAGYLCEND